MTGIRYAQCWEDPTPLTRGLRITPGDDVVSIASGGDNSFALLLHNPRSLAVVDSNPAQLFLVELKIRAVQELDYENFVDFVGARPCRHRQRLYTALRASLTDQARSYWDGQAEGLQQGIIHCGKFESYLRIFSRYVVPLIHRRRTVRKLLAPASREGQRIFYDEVWNNRRWRWLFRVFFGRFLLGHLGRDPSYFRYVALDDVGEELLRRTQHGLTEVPTGDNAFLEYILTGRYSDLETAHPYLRESNFASLKANVGRVQLVHGSLEDHLAGLQPSTVSKLNLSDIFEYMSDDAYELALREILRVCRPSARLGLWTLFIPRAIPPSLADRIRSVSSITESGERFASSRTFFYGGFHLWKVNPG